MSVLITRPDVQGKALLEMLNQHQIFAIHQPFFTLEMGADLPQLPTLLSRLNTGDYVFAVSKQAISFAAETLANTGFSFRNDLNYFAVGLHSAVDFASKSEQVVRYPIHSENSEGVLALPEMQNLTGKNLLILRANTGRDLIAQIATERGAQVQYVECYTRKEIEENISEKISLAKRAGVNMIVVTSGEILTTLYEQTVEGDRQWLIESKLIVVSPRIQKIAEKLGWDRKLIAISPKADNATLLDTILKSIDKAN